MSRELFFNLLKRYLAGQCTDEEKKIVEQWYTMLDDDDLSDLSEENLAEIDERVWLRVSDAMQQQSKKQEKSLQRRRYLWPAIAVAASLIGFLVIILYFSPQGHSTPQFLVQRDTAEVIIEKNKTTEASYISLPDSSVVTLYPGATLTYPQKFLESKRTVALEGEAFFEVTKDPTRPFYVYSPDLVTRVVGTSFLVRADDHKREVAVRTGKVVVARQEAPNLYKRMTGDKSEVVLTPNQKAVYKNKTQSLSVTLVDDPQPIPQPDGVAPASFVFDETPLKDVFKAVENTYGIKINVTKQEINECTFTGDLSDQNIYTQMEFICTSIQAVLKVKGASLLIEGGICQ